MHDVVLIGQGLRTARDDRRSSTVCPGCDKHMDNHDDLTCPWRRTGKQWSTTGGYMCLERGCYFVSEELGAALKHVADMQERVAA